MATVGVKGYNHREVNAILSDESDHAFYVEIVQHYSRDGVLEDILVSRIPEDIFFIFWWPVSLNDCLQIGLHVISCCCTL